MALFNRNRGSEQQTEMTFVDHLEVLRGHLFRSAIAIAVGGGLIAYYNNFFIKKVLMGPTHKEFPTYSWLCTAGQQLGFGRSFCMKEINLRMQSTTVSGQFNMFFTVILIGGIIIAFPYVFYEFWKFIKPALTKKELGRTKGVIFWVSFLFFLGVFFGYFVIAPYTVNFFANFQLDETIENRWSISSYIDTLVPLILGSGLAFQLPLVVLFLSKVGIVTASYLRKVRKFAIIIIVIVAGVITPPDVVSQIIVSLPLLLLYEISIGISARVARQLEKDDAKEWS